MKFRLSEKRKHIELLVADEFEVSKVSTDNDVSEDKFVDKFIKKTEIENSVCYMNCV